MEVFGRIGRLLALGEPPAVPEVLSQQADLVAFLDSVEAAVEERVGQTTGLERTLAEARLRQLNLGTRGLLFGGGGRSFCLY